MKKTQRVLRPASCVLRAGFALLLLLGLLTQPGAWAVPGDIAGGPGDEPDGSVGIADLNRVLGGWNQNCDPGDWTVGDITGDGFVGIEDLNTVLGHYNQSDPDPFLGTNLGPVVYWNSSWAFVDVMKMARPWLVNWNSLDPQYIDANGWPTENPGGQTVFTHVFDKISGHYPVGTVLEPYVLTWECDDPNPNATDEVSAQGNGSSNVSETTDPNNRRRKLLTVIPDNQGIRINVDNINPQYPIYNIRLWMPGFENAQSPFHPTFIDRLKTFKVIRFMDWQKINSSPEVQWSDRKQPTNAFQNDNTGGVALEYIVQLCNELEADPWFCMPHQADDNYVTQFAQYVKDNLDNPDATIYVEWSNELWNRGFGQYHWLGPIPRNDDWFNKWANEAGNDFQIWHTVFKATSPVDSRDIIRVVAGQKDDDWIIENVLEKDGLKDLSGLPGEVLFDAVACSTYLDSSVAGYDSGASTPEEAADSILFHTIHRTIPLYDTSNPEDPDPPLNEDSNTQFYTDHAGWADYYSTQTGRTIDFISYEGGQHFVRIYSGSRQNTHVPTSVLLAIQRRPDIYKAYVDNIKAFKDAGGSLFMAYHSVGKYDQDDTFGHYEFQDESINNSTKHRAVIGGGGR